MIGQLRNAVSKFTEKLCPAELDDRGNVEDALEKTTPPTSDDLDECCSCSDSTCCESRKCSMSGSAGIMTTVMFELLGATIAAVTVGRPYYAPTPNNTVGDLIIQSVGGVTGGVLMLLGIGMGAVVVRNECC